MNRVKVPPLVSLAVLAWMILAGAESKLVAAPQPASTPTVGEPAPEIVGKDVHNKAMKLGDFRGKIVVLDFFGDW